MGHWFKIKAKSSKDAREILEKFHNELVGNKDYIDSNIVLSSDTLESDNIIDIIVANNCDTEVSAFSSTSSLIDNDKTSIQFNIKNRKFSDVNSGCKVSTYKHSNIDIDVNKIIEFSIIYT